MIMYLYFEVIAKGCRQIILHFSFNCLVIIMDWLIKSMCLLRFMNRAILNRYKHHKMETTCTIIFNAFSAKGTTTIGTGEDASFPTF
jgi:hypothetical protein